MACSSALCHASRISFRMLWPLVILLCFAESVGFSQQIPAAQRAYAEGLLLEKDGHHEQAARKFLEAIEINPEFSDAYYSLGSSDLHAGRTEEAIKAFLQLAQIEPENIKATLAAADAYVGLELYDDALALYSRALRLNPKSAIVHYEIGYVLFHKKEYTDAIGELERAISLNPLDIPAHRLVASAYLAIGNAGAAQKRLHEAMVQNQNSPELPTDLANVLLGEHLVSEAEHQFEIALAVRPDYIPAQLGLAKLHRRNGRAPLALKEVSDVLKQDPENAAAVLEKGQCEYALGSLDSAARDFEQFSRMQPDSAEGEYLLGLLDLTASRYPSAVKHFNQAVQKDTKLGDAYYYMAQAYYKNRQTIQAEQALAACLEIDPANERAIELRATMAKTDSHHAGALQQK
jgi:tetratricopeptide (TPR) repeat protein